MFEKLFGKNNSKGEKFNSYLDVSGMEELRDTILDLSSSKKYSYLTNHEGILHDEFKSIKTTDSGFAIISNAKIGLSDSLFSSDLIQFMNFRAIYELLWLSCEAENQKKLSDRELNNILESDLPFKLSLGLDEFSMVKDFSHLDVWFFKRLANVRFEKRAERLHSSIQKGFLSDLNDDLNIHFLTFNSLAFSAEYFMACYAIYDDRDSINEEDVVKGWTLMLNLFLSDIRPLILD